MRILSYDIGIKNLAFCLVDYDVITKKLVIEEWNIINLLENEFNNELLCKYINKNKPYNNCKNTAIFSSKNNNFSFCKRHISKFHIQDLSILPITDNIISICDENDCSNKSKYYVNNKKLCSKHKNITLDFHNQNYILKKIKTISANNYPIDKIADKMITILDEKYLHLLNCDIVLLELQVMKSPRIKTLSNYLYMYYRMNGIHYKKNNSYINDVRYIMASSKLRFNKNNTTENIQNYNNRKKTGIDNVNEYLTNNQLFDNKIWFNKQKKQDDLADALLQILIYLERNFK